MKIAKILLILAVAGFVVAGCEREGKLTPTGPENVYGPQTIEEQGGPFKAELLQLFEDYNTLFLYKYIPHDLYYMDRYWLGGSYDPETDQTLPGSAGAPRPSGVNYNVGYFDVPADEQYIGEQLDILKETVFEFYTDEVLFKLLPKKVFLVDSLYWSGARTGLPQRNVVQAWASNDFFAVTWGAERILSMTPAQKMSFKNEVNNVLFGLAANKDILAMPVEFGEVSSYDWESYDWTKPGIDGTLQLYTYDPVTDWQQFLAWIGSTTYAEKTTQGGKGFLHPSYDVNGLVMEKYLIMVDYFNSLGIDIEAMAEATF